MSLTDDTQRPPIAAEAVPKPTDDLRSHVRVGTRDGVGELLAIFVPPGQEALLTTHNLLGRLAIELLGCAATGRGGLLEIDTVSLEKVTALLLIV